MAKSKGGADKKTVIIVKRGDGGHQAHHGGSWKVAYADFVTAMMALFLLLWLLATLKPSQKEQLALVFQDKKADNPSKDMVAPKLPTYVAKDMLKGYPQFKLSQDNKLKYEIALMIKELVAADPKVKANSGISTDNQGVLLHVNSSVMFQPNTAQLLPEAQKVLDDVIKVMRDHKIDLTIRGHVDDSENGGHLYPSKWELSAARAAAAARYVTEKGAIPPTRVQATGYGDSRPLVPPTTPENRAQNRRVEFYYQSPDTKAN